MYTLFIDTHFKDVCLGLYNKNRLIDLIQEKDIKTTSEITMPLLKKLLDRNKIKLENLKKIVVCIGPGSFTGVRVGVTIAKLIAYLLNIPIYTINSLELAAFSDGYNHELYGTLENNGVFIAQIKDKKIVGNIEYYKNSEIPKNVFICSNDDVSQLLTDFDIFKEESPFSVNPLYIKELNINSK